MCQDAISHEQYFHKEIKGKLILSKNSCTSYQSKPEVNSWVVLCRILSFSVRSISQGCNSDY